MIQFNSLKITDNKQLIINAQVKEDTYYDNVYIHEIIIDDKDSFTDGTPSENPVYKYTFPEESNEKSINITLDTNDGLGLLNKNIYFVYIVTKGAPAANTPCGEDNIYTLGITYYEQYILSNYLAFMKEIENTCSVPKTFIDYYLRVKAFELSLETGNYIQAIKYWNRFFSKNPVINISNSCGCYGNN